VLERTLRSFAIVAAVLVIAGWGAFAWDETRAASNESQAQIAGTAASSLPDPTPAQERAREHVHSQTREWVDDANDVLLKPFAPLVDGSSSRWARRSIAALMALLVYGFGAAYVARFARGRTS
jgi:hypothetical protein